MSNTSVSFKIGTDNSEALRKLKELRDEFKTLHDSLKNTATDIKIKIQADTASISGDVAAIKHQIKTQMGQMEIDVKFKADTSALTSSANTIKNQIKTQLGEIEVPIKFNKNTLNAELLQIKNRIKAYFSTGFAVRIVPTLTSADATAARARLQGLVNKTYKARVGINLAYLNSQIALARAQLATLTTGGININIDATATSLINALNELRDEVKRLRTSMSGSGSGGGAGGGGAGGAGLLAGLRANLMGLVATYAGATGAAALFNQTISAQREFDILNAQLETATKSAENAKIAFDALQDFAKKTPYDLKQAVEGFTKLVNLGLTPSERALMSYGNTAASMGKDLMQMIEAVADASTGEFERLKEFGIKAKQEGDKVSFTFQGVTKTIGNNAAEIEEYLLRIGENEFAGAMAKRIDTLDGSISALKDNWKLLFLEISKAGVGDLIKDAVDKANDEIELLIDLLKSGAIQSSLSGITRAFTMFSNDAIDDMDSIGKSFSGLSKHLVAVWRGTVAELNVISNSWVTIRSLAQKAGVAAAAGVDIVTDPFNKRTTNQQKEENWRGLFADIDQKAVDDWDAPNKGLTEAEKKWRAYQEQLKNEREKDKEDKLAQFKLSPAQNAGIDAPSAASSKAAKRAAEEAAREAEELMQAKYEHESKLLEQQIKYNKIRYDNEEISFHEYITTKNKLIADLHQLELKQLDQQAAQATAHERSLLGYKRSSAMMDHNDRIDAMRQEQLEYVKNLESIKEKVAGQLDDFETEISDLRATDLERDLAAVAHRFKDARDNINELRKQLKDGMSVDVDLPNGKSVVVNSGIINEIQAQLDQQESELSTYVTLIHKPKEIQKNVERILSNKDYMDRYDQIQLARDPMSRAEVAIRADQRNKDTIGQLKAELLDLETLKSLGEDVADQIDELTLTINELELATRTPLEKFKADLVETSITAAESGLSSYFMDIVEGTKTANQALKDLARSFISSIAQMAAQALAKIAIFALLNSLTGGAFASSGIAKTMGLDVFGKKHTGGLVDGKDQNYKIDKNFKLASNEVPTILEKGEEVLTASDPRHRNNFDMNAHLAKILPRYHTGGIAGFAPDSDFMRTVNNIDVRPQTTSTGTDSGSVVVQIHNIVKKEDVLDIVASEAGQKIIVNDVFGQNTSAIKVILDDN